MTTILATAASSTTTMVVYLIVMAAMLIFLFYLPNKRQAKRDNEMRNSLEIGDEVTTTVAVHYIISPPDQEMECVLVRKVRDIVEEHLSCPVNNILPSLSLLPLVDEKSPYLVSLNIYGAVTIPLRHHIITVPPDIIAVKVDKVIC